MLCKKTDFTDKIIGTPELSKIIKKLKKNRKEVFDMKKESMEDGNFT